MDNFKEMLKKNYWIFGIVAVAGITIVIILNTVYSKKEIKGWNFGKVYAKKCPYLGGYPLYWKNFLDKKYLPPMQDAANEINMESQHRLKLKGSLYKQLTGPRKPGQIVVEFRDAPESLYAFKKLCEPFKLGDKGDATTAGGVAEFQATWKDGKLVSAVVLVCTKKIEDGMKLMNTPITKKLKLLGWKGTFKHEMMHGILGAEKHTQWGGTLMVESPSLTTISDHVFKIMETHIIPICRKNGLLGE